MKGITEDIISLIPQRQPFVMINRLISYDEQVTRTGFDVTADNIFTVKGKFTEPGLVENIAQTAAARAGYVATLDKKPVQVGYIGAIKNLVIHSLPMVNDELETTVTIQSQVFDVTLVYGEVRCNGGLVAACEMKIFIVPSK